MIEVQVIRGTFVESSHNVSCVVVDELGNRVHSFGDSERVTSPRSASKLLQALPFVASGAVDHFKLSDRHICLSCASHNSEDFHLELVDDWLKAVGLDEDCFFCGSHWPYHEPTKHRWIQQGKVPTPKVNNCSGKHLGIMTTALYHQEDVKSYYQYDHPRQKEIRRVLSEVTQFNHDEAKWGIDGCGIPTYAVPLYNIALGFSYLICSKGVSADLQKASSRIISAIRKHPLYIAGTNEFNSNVISQTEGRCVLKLGAEAVYCGVLPEKGLAFALKTNDGSSRASEAATRWLLNRLGEKNIAVEQPVKNWKGHEVGKIKVLDQSLKL
jgi:L-asparaginase II